jgi:hypothetical protein
MKQSNLLLHLITLLLSVTLLNECAPKPTTTPVSTATLAPTDTPVPTPMPTPQCEATEVPAESNWML